MVQTEQRLDNCSLPLEVLQVIVYMCLLPNGKRYIGQTHRELKDRISEHIRKSKVKTEAGYNYPFYRAIRKYGIENLEWSIIDYADSSEQLNTKEKYWISHYDTYIQNGNGYNQTFGGEGQNGLSHSDKTKEKIRISELGENNTRAKLTKEQVLKIVELSNGGLYSQVEFSKLFNVSEGTISRILSGLRWSSVTGINYNKNGSLYCE